MDHRVIITEQKLTTLRLQLRDIRSSLKSLHQLKDTEYAERYIKDLKQEEWEFTLAIRLLEYELDNLNDVTTEHTPAPTA